MDFFSLNLNIIAFNVVPSSVKIFKTLIPLKTKSLVAVWNPFVFQLFSFTLFKCLTLHRLHLTTGSVVILTFN